MPIPVDSAESLHRQRLANLKMRLDQVSRAWTVDDYWAMVRFYANALPRFLNAERCSIYLIEMGTEKICSIVATGLDKKEIKAPKEGSMVGRTISSGIPMIAKNLDAQTGYHKIIDEETGFITRDMVCAPIKSLTGHGVTGAIQVINKKGGGSFFVEEMDLVNDIAKHLSISIESIMLNREILRISSQLNREMERCDPGWFKDASFIAESPSMKEILETVRLLSATPVNVYIQGENGTGKELIARMIHEQSDRSAGPFVAVNCAAIPDQLMESEFFGYEKGAFTGADRSRKGYFEEARGGTLFLDEIADMPLAIQPKFLRAIQESEGCRLGSNRPIPYHFRTISATNRSLAREVEAGRFREDLFFRLFSVEIHIPPLRERKEAISPMAFLFLADTCRRFKKEVAGFSPEILNRFARYDWPGNVRQLRREIERLVALTPANERILPDKLSLELVSDLPAASRRVEGASLPEQVEILEKKLIETALRETGGNKTKAAERLGITRQGFYKKLARYRLGSSCSPRPV